MCAAVGFCVWGCYGALYFHFILKFVFDFLLALRTRWNSSFRALVKRQSGDSKNRMVNSRVFGIELIKMNPRKKN